MSSQTLQGTKADGTYAPILVDSTGIIQSTSPSNPEVVTLVVRPTPGAGEFASPKLANDSIIDSSAVKNYKILIYPGTYTEVNWIVAPYTYLEGTDRDNCILKGELPSSSSDATIAATSTIWLKQTAGLRNLTITARNMRYPVHSEDVGNNQNAVHNIFNCYIEHYGNADVVSYRSANSLPAGSPWTACIPWGYGSASGVTENFCDTTFVSPRDVAAWFVHNNADFTKPNVNTLTRCRFINPTYGVQADPYKSQAVSIRGLGSGTRDSVVITDSELTQTIINESDSPWTTTTAAGQYANHSDFDITVVGSTPIGFVTNNRGKALRIRNTSNSFGVNTTVVSGTSVPVIFGSLKNGFGGGGIASYVYGTLDISGILVGINEDQTVTNTLGRRLGNCSVSTKTLTVTIQSTNLTVTHTFNKDYTAMTNTAILAEINTTFGANITAEEYLVSQGEVYPQFPDRQATLINTSAAGIVRFAPVKIVDGGVQMMATNDPISLFAGVALDNIVIGSRGRILREGLVNSAQLRGYGTSIVSGAAIYLSDATAGNFAQTGTRQIMTGRGIGFAYFKGVTV